jgi:hypothetical protein
MMQAKSEISTTIARKINAPDTRPLPFLSPLNREQNRQHRGN